eukprot:GHVU01086822.1.p1 GENE.GHVU01086822.1~~GHVU01086822.1.p1  ORF type:complete len:100 (+),score=34.19 GHVU01086822.1:961-1260(+)
MPPRDGAVPVTGDGSACQQALGGEGEHEGEDEEEETEEEKKEHEEDEEEDEDEVEEEGEDEVEEADGRRQQKIIDFNIPSSMLPLVVRSTRRRNLQQSD